MFIEHSINFRLNGLDGPCNSRYHKVVVKFYFILLHRIALGLITYGISFGITRLSGSIYLNLFLFKLVQIPSKSIAIWLQNRYVYVLLGKFMNVDFYKYV